MFFQPSCVGRWRNADWIPRRERGSSVLATKQQVERSRVGPTLVCAHCGCAQCARLQWVSACMGKKRGVDEERVWVQAAIRRWGEQCSTASSLITISGVSELFP